MVVCVSAFGAGVPPQGYRSLRVVGFPRFLVIVCMGHQAKSAAHLLLVPLCISSFEGIKRPVLPDLYSVTVQSLVALRANPHKLKGVSSDQCCPAVRPVARWNACDVQHRGGHPQQLKAKTSEDGGRAHKVKAAGLGEGGLSKASGSTPVLKAHGKVREVLHPSSAEHQRTRTHSHAFCSKQRSTSVLFWLVAKSLSNEQNLQ